ncbi:hypothetical protein MYX76_03090 [Desulfobacterota bacterium AH_259_B03_O07]|nr:hypothetical protein [Desulfobacterota bacterium AH_259_B03_O07]
MEREDSRQIYIFKSYINSFHYLYQDAEYFHKIAKDKSLSGKLDRVRFSRNAILLYVLSLEALVNRAIDFFLSGKARDIILEREDRFSITDKWLILPILINKDDESTFDTSRYPWSHFNELAKIRNDFVHPKHDRVAFYKAVSNKTHDCLDYNEVPKDSDIKETDIVYRNTRIPKDPYCLLPHHTDTVKKIVDDIIDNLDKLLEGKIKKDNWLHSDAFQLIYPKGAKINDIN